MSGEDHIVQTYIQALHQTFTSRPKHKYQEPDPPGVYGESFLQYVLYIMDVKK